MDECKHKWKTIEKHNDHIIRECKKCGFRRRELKKKILRK